jgi:cytochrome c biogenesis protein CcmG, thiol:disulfide interchange protein DsbE
VIDEVDETEAADERHDRPSWSRWRTVALVLSPFVLFAVVLASGLGRDPGELPSELIGQPASTFSLPRLDADGTIDLEDLEGQVVVVNFWASWCVPCRDEAPVLEAAWQAHRDRGVVIVGVNVQDSEHAARAFIETFGLTFSNGPDPGGRIAIDYGVYGIPETFVIGRDGRIAYKHVGVIAPSTLEARIQGALQGIATLQEGRSGQYQRVQ